MLEQDHGGHVAAMEGEHMAELPREYELEWVSHGYLVIDTTLFLTMMKPVSSHSSPRHCTSPFSE